MAETAFYTREEVNKNNGRGGIPIWVIYKDSVYNLTEFVHEHPGGVETIVDEAGRDVTKAFNSVGHSSDAKSMMRKYKIGELYESERSAPPKKKVIPASGDKEGRSCINIITCGLIG